MSKIRRENTMSRKEPEAGGMVSTPAKTVTVKLRPIGVQDYEVWRGKSVEGIAHFERYWTTQGVETRGWIIRPGQEILYSNPGYYEDFARTVRKIFG